MKERESAIGPAAMARQDFNREKREHGLTEDDFLAYLIGWSAAYVRLKGWEKDQ